MIGRRLDKILTLPYDLLRTGIAHKEPCNCLFPLKREQGEKIIRHLCQQRKIIFNITFGTKRVFCEQDRELCLNAECRAERLFIEQKISAGEFRVEPVLKNGVSDLLRRSQFFKRKIVEHFPIIFTGSQGTPLCHGASIPK